MRKAFCVVIVAMMGCGALSVLSSDASAHTETWLMGYYLQRGGVGEAGVIQALNQSKGSRATIIDLTGT